MAFWIVKHVPDDQQVRSAKGDARKGISFCAAPARHKAIEKSKNGWRQSNDEHIRVETLARMCCVGHEEEVPGSPSRRERHGDRGCKELVERSRFQGMELRSVDERRDLFFQYYQPCEQGLDQTEVMVAVAAKGRLGFDLFGAIGALHRTDHPGRRQTDSKLEQVTFKA